MSRISNDNSSVSLLRLDYKSSCKVVLTSNEADLSLIIPTEIRDGITLLLNDRILLIAQASTYENGIYIVTSLGAIRASDANSSPKISSGMTIPITEGTNANTEWILTVTDDDPVVLGATPLIFQIKPIPSITPIDLTFATTLTPDCSDGLFRSCTLTDDVTLMPPTNASNGMRWEGWLTASGADRDLSIDAGILIPTDSSFTSPKTLTSGKLYIVLLKYNGSAWMLVSLVGGY